MLLNFINTLKENITWKDLIILVLVLYLLYKINIVEKLTDTTEDNIRQTVKDVYQVDVQAIKNLGEVARTMLDPERNILTLPFKVNITGGLEVDGTINATDDINTTGKNISIKDKDTDRTIFRLHHTGTAAYLDYKNILNIRKDIYQNNEFKWAEQRLQIADNVDVTHNAIIGGYIDAKGNIGAGGDIRSGGNVKGKTFRLNGDGITHEEAKGDGVFYRSGGQVYIGHDDNLYIRNNNNSKGVHFRDDFFEVGNVKVINNIDMAGSLNGNIINTKGAITSASQITGTSFNSTGNAFKHGKYQLSFDGNNNSCLKLDKNGNKHTNC